jgi:hypothetical protein
MRKIMFFDRKLQQILNHLSLSPIYKKIALISSQQSKKPEKVITVLSNGEFETENISKIGDFIITNPSGEKYIMSEKKFLSLHVETSTPGIYSCNRYCHAVKNPTGSKIEILGSWGMPQFGDSDCFIADSCDLDGNNMKLNPYLIAFKSFNETYQIVN